MGKPVRFRRGIATVIPDCESGTDSQITSLRGFSRRLRLTDIDTETMLQQHTPLRGSRRSALALIALLAQAPARAEENKDELEPLIVSALRVPRPASTVTSAVTVLDPEALQNQGLFQLRDALNTVPGVISTSTGGQTGAVGSLFIRGTTTNYSQIVVDGMRLSDSTTPLGNVLSGGRVYDVGSLEVLRGPQGAIYGGESIGGVLWMETPHGSGAPHGSATLEAGSFQSFAAHAMFQGETPKLSYFLSGGYEETDNDGPDQNFHQANSALRVEGKIDPIWTVGTTYRAFNNFYDDHGSSDNRVDFSLATLYATGVISDRWTARFLVGYQQEFYDNDSAYGNYGTDMRAGSISTDHEIKLAEDVRLLAGAYFHQSAYENTINTDESRDRYGVHAALEWDIIKHLTATAALRWEDYDAYGDELTWRTGSIYTIESTGTAIRGGVGSSFRAPSYLDLFGSSYGTGNPDLQAESSIGWDFGVQQKIGSHHSLEATWFQNHITDQIQAYPTPPVNLSGDTVTEGLEFGIRGGWLENTLNYRLAWTYLLKSLSDQPRNTATASLDWKPTPKSLIGIGATHLSDHSWGGDPLASYTVARLYGSYQICEKVKLHARLENAFDENYQLASFGGSTIEGAGTGIYAGITVDW
jgi:outer membrane cobalamin receptor